MGGSPDRILTTSVCKALDDYPNTLSELDVHCVDGWYCEDDRQVYVNPGIGASVVPWRYGRPAMREVAIIDLIGGPVAVPLRL